MFVAKCWRTPIIAHKPCYNVYNFGKIRWNHQPQFLIPQYAKQQTITSNFFHTSSLVQYTSTIDEDGASVTALNSLRSIFKQKPETKVPTPKPPKQEITDRQESKYNNNNNNNSNSYNRKKINNYNNNNNNSRASNSEFNRYNEFHRENKFKRDTDRGYNDNNRYNKKEFSNNKDYNSSYNNRNDNKKDYIKKEEREKGFHKRDRDEKKIRSHYNNDNDNKDNSFDNRKKYNTNTNNNNDNTNNDRGNITFYKYKERDDVKRDNYKKDNKIRNKNKNDRDDRNDFSKKKEKKEYSPTSSSSSSPSGTASQQSNKNNITATKPKKQSKGGSLDHPSIINHNQKEETFLDSSININPALSEEDKFYKNIIENIEKATRYYISGDVEKANHIYKLLNINNEAKIECGLIYIQHSSEPPSSLPKNSSPPKSKKKSENDDEGGDDDELFELNAESEELLEDKEVIRESDEAFWIGFNLIKQAADDGHPNGRCILGCLLLEDEDVSDKSEALNYLKLSDTADSNFFLGHYYSNHSDHDVSKDQIIAYFKRASELGSVDGACTLLNLFIRGFVDIPKPELISLAKKVVEAHQDGSDDYEFSPEVAISILNNDNNTENSSTSTGTVDNQNTTIESNNNSTTSESPQPTTSI